jgi:N-acetyl-alpha-D-muramate 1-phosphate uridylyltransferase
LSSPEIFPVAILAGGLATRLHPLTLKIPKGLVEVAGKPFVCRQLHYLRHQGITKVLMCVGYRGEQIEALVGDGKAFGLKILYSYDGASLLGTGGALRRALPSLSKQFFVLYGDSYLPCDFPAAQKAFVESGKPALMTVLRNEGRWDRSNVSFLEDRIVEYNKSAPRPEMDYIDYGLGILSAAVLESYPEGRAFDLATVYHELSHAKQLAGFEVHERFYEIGSHRGLKEAEAYFSARDTV